MKFKWCGKNQLWPNWGNFALSKKFNRNKADNKSDKREIICWYAVVDLTGLGFYAVVSVWYVY
jgi:hypothetical protein